MVARRRPGSSCAGNAWDTWSARGAVKDGPLLVGPGPGKNKGPDGARRDEENGLLI